jgi:hypothetical protein
MKGRKKTMSTGTSCVLHYQYNGNVKYIDNNQWFQIVSIDIGTKNYAIRVERRKNGIVECLIFDKVDVSSENVNVCEVYQNVTDFLDGYTEILKSSKLILIEKQLKVNYKATRIMQHTLTYFALLLKHNNAKIYEVDPKLKGKILGVPKGIKNKELKKWASSKARKILEERNEDFSLGVLNFFMKKQDDLADTICQIEAFLIYFKLEL